MNKYYQILELPAGASKKKLRSAFRRLAKLYHPDINGSEEAKIKFLQITEAYDSLYYGKTVRKRFSSSSKNDKPPPPRETVEEKRQRYAKARTKKSTERNKKEAEAFRNSHFYDIFQILKFIVRLAALFIAFLFITLPVMAFLSGLDLSDNFHLVLFFLVGLGLSYKLYKNRRNYFKIGPLNFSFQDIKKLFVSNANTKQFCFFTKRKNADGPAYRLRFYRTEEIKTQVSTPLNHKVRIKSTVKLVHVSRTLFAFKVHFASKIIRFLSIVFTSAFLPIDSFVWQVFFGVLISILINQSIYFFTKVKSDFYFLMNYFTLIRVGLVLFVLFAATDFTNFQFVHTELLGIWIIILILFSDLIITPIVVEIPNNKLLRSIGKANYSKIEKLLDEEFQIGYVESIPSAFYVIFKWFF